MSMDNTPDPDREVSEPERRKPARERRRDARRAIADAKCTTCGHRVGDHIPVRSRSGLQQWCQFERCGVLCSPRKAVASA